MWVPSQVVDWFHISKQTVESLREELAAVRADRDALKLQINSNQITTDWLRVKVNTLEAEKATLIEIAYKIKMPVPELMQTSRIADPTDAILNQALFEDMGDKLARKFGMPTYDDTPKS